MKKIDKTIIWYILVAIGMLGVQLLASKYLNNYSRLINLIMWGIVFTILQFVKIEPRRYQNLNYKLVYTILIMIGYYVAFFALGFYYGYSNNPYSQKISAIIENVIFIIGLALLQEYTRCYLLNTTRGVISHICIAILFALFSIEFLNFSYYFRSAESTLEYVFGELVIIIISSCISTYFALKGGIKLSFTYAIIRQLGIILMPILPKLNWFVECVLELVTGLILFLTIHYLNSYRSRNIDRKEVVKLHPIKTIPVIALLTIFTLFVAGLLPYKPVAVMSNSMVPVFSRGDIIIIKKISEDEIKKLQEGTIVEYKVESGSSIVHRIKTINSINNQLVFTTKGDNNVSADTDKVQESQIKGVVTMVIPYIGFPSVYFSQFVLNINPTIDT